MISIFMKSSSPELCYELKVGWAEEFDSKFLKISCECQAADREVMCKHRLSVIENDYQFLLDDDQLKPMDEAYELVKQTELPAVAKKMRDAEAQLKSLQNDVRNLKRSLERRIRKGSI